MGCFVVLEKYGEISLQWRIEVGGSALLILRSCHLRVEAPAPPGSAKRQRQLIVLVLLDFADGVTTLIAVRIWSTDEVKAPIHPPFPLVFSQDLERLVLPPHTKKARSLDPGPRC